MQAVFHDSFVYSHYVLNLYLNTKHGFNLESLNTIKSDSNKLTNTNLLVWKNLNETEWWCIYMISTTKMNCWFIERHQSKMFTLVVEKQLKQREWNY